MAKRPVGAGLFEAVVLAGLSLGVGACYQSHEIEVTSRPDFGPPPDFGTPPDFGPPPDLGPCDDDCPYCEPSERPECAGCPTVCIL